jgi:hypothetical protein
MRSNGGATWWIDCEPLLLLLVDGLVRATYAGIGSAVSEHFAVLYMVGSIRGDRHSRSNDAGAIGRAYSVLNVI